MDFLETSILPYINRKKQYNIEKYGSAYIEYSPEQFRFDLGESNGYSDKVLRIPSACFCTVEYCHVLKNNDKNDIAYELATYTPCVLPLHLKCGAFLGKKNDDEFHRHDYFEMVYVYQGYRTMVIENQTVVLHENDFCIFDMQCAHLDLRSQSEGIAFYCGFTRQQIDTFFLSSLKNPTVKKFFTSKDEKTEDIRYLIAEISKHNTSDILQLFAGIIEELDGLQEGSERITQVYLIRILNHIKNSDEEIHVYGKKLKGTKLFQAVAKYIYSNISSISIQELCRVFHYQADYYNRMIKKNTGQTYSEYIRNMRLERAKNLLINTDFSVKQIMEYLGYSSHTYFYTVFEKNTGYTPMEFRKKYRSTGI